MAPEGALKLNEVSYLHAEAYPASELEHGPLALIAPETPTVVVLPRDELLAKGCDIDQPGNLAKSVTVE